MRKPVFISVFLAAMSFSLFAPAALAKDLKPGTWEVTSSMTGKDLPERLKKEKTDSQCLPGSGKIDMAKTMREGWTNAGCPDINISREGNTISAQAECSSHGRTSTVEAQIKIQSDERYTATTITKNDGTTTLKQTGRWVSPDCQ
ncbi:DUF3617 domain-containing protein [Marinobacter oulmenensis]|uniref:DUF3617 family protein n=1 Tax=Marinobacter oulmenensis TaxID=643747 RepID=A0A840U6L9_9GAMM|nr:DUF3617 family protein [Marinobacter oulmenensis]MBB5320769.1 hypothetical protein [Marinobacter oulmenensis]